VTSKSATASDKRAAYAVKEAAELIGVSRSMLYLLMKNGALRTVKLGGRRLVPRDAIEALLAGASK
jgi:excisionase family DNA binding protein